METTKELFNKRELSAYLRVSQNTVNREMTRGNLEYVKVGKSVRFTREQIVNYISKNSNRGES